MSNHAGGRRTEGIRFGGPPVSLPGRPRAREATGGKGVQVVLDIVGGEYFARNLDCLASEGRLIQVGVMGGSLATIDLKILLRRQLTLIGSTLRQRTVVEKGAIAAELRSHVWSLLSEGRVAPVICATFSLDAAADAHRLMESNCHIGKIVLQLAAVA